MSQALVPGCMRLLELASRMLCSNWEAWRLAAGSPDGEFGPIWISAGGGGLGSRGELGASAMVELDGVCREDANVAGAARLPWRFAPSCATGSALGVCSVGA